MKNLIFILLFSVVMCVPGCTSITVTYDYDREFDFSTLYAYDWIFIPEWSGADELMAEQLKRAVDGELEMRGYALKPAYPDFLISVRARREKKTELYESGYVHDPYYSRGYPFWAPSMTAIIPIVA